MKAGGVLASVGSQCKQNLFSVAVRKQAMRKQAPLKGYSKKADWKGADFVVLGTSSNATQALASGSSSIL